MVERRRGSAREGPTIVGTFVAFATVFLDRLAPLYVVGQIAGDFGVPASVQGTLALAIGLGWAASMAVAWWTSGRWDDRRRMLLAVFAAAVVDGVSVLAPSWAVFVLLRGIGGVLAGSSSPVATALTFAAAPEHRRGLDFGIVQSASRVGGSLVSPVVVTAVAVAFGWRAGLLVPVVLMVVGAATLMLVVPPRPPPEAVGSAHAAARLHYRRGGRRNVAVSTLGSIALLGWLVIVSQGGVPLLEGWLGLGTAAAGRVLGWFGLGAAVGALSVPLLSDRFGRRTTLIGATTTGAVAGAAIAALATFEVGSVAVATVLLTAGGLAMGGLPMVIALIPAEAVTSGDVGRAVAVPIIGAEVLGSAALPAVAFALAPAIGLPTVVGFAAALLAIVAAISPLLTAPGRQNG